MALLEFGEQRGDRCWRAPRAPATGARLRMQRVKAAFVVEAQPVAQGLLGHAAAARDVVVATGIGPQRGGSLGRDRRQMQQFGKDAETEEGHFMRQLGIRFWQGSSWDWERLSVAGPTLDRHA